MQYEILLKKYPIAYKKIMDSLRHSLEVVGEKGVTANAIYENIKHIARMDSIEEILDKASWAKKNGSRYIFSEEIIDKNEIIEENNDYISEEASSEQSRNQKVDFYNIFDAYTALDWCISNNQENSDYYNLNMKEIKKYEKRKF